MLTIVASFAGLDTTCSVLPIPFRGKEGWPWVDSSGINIHRRFLYITHSIEFSQTAAYF